MTTYCKFALACSFFICLHVCQAQPPEFPGVVSILDTQLALIHQNNLNSGLIVEYIDPDETLDDWALLFAVRFFEGDGLDPRTSVQAKAAEIEARKKSDSMAKAMMLQGTDIRSYIIDYLVSVNSILEHNLYRYFNTERGLVSYQIARRIDTNLVGPAKVREFIDSIPENRDKLLLDIMRKDMEFPLAELGQ